MGATRVAALALLLCAVVRGQSCGSIALSGTSSGIVTPMSFEGDFTIECWAKSSDLTNNPSLFFLEGVDTSEIDIQASWGYIEGIIIDDAWHHYALSRAGSYLTSFFDGASNWADQIDGTLGSPSSALHIGGYWRGSFADIRIVKGRALYT